MDGRAAVGGVVLDVVGRQVGNQIAHTRRATEWRGIGAPDAPVFTGAGLQSGAAGVVHHARGHPIDLAAAAGGRGVQAERCGVTNQNIAGAGQTTVTRPPSIDCANTQGRIVTQTQATDTRAGRHSADGIGCVAEFKGACTVNYQTVARRRDDSADTQLFAAGCVKQAVAG